MVADKPIPPWSARQIILALEELGAEAFYIRPSEIASFVGPKNGLVHARTLRPLELEAAVLRDLGSTTTLELFLRRIDVFKYIESLGVPVINPVDAYLTARDKYLSLCILSRHGLPVPRTIVVEDFYAATKVVELWGRAVIKPLVGSLGFGVIRVENSDMAYSIARTLLQLGQPIYVQEYVEKPGRDIRVLVVGDEIVAAYYRVQPNPNNWKTNIAQGAVAKPIEKVDRELEELSIKALKALGLYYAGIDLAESKDGYVIFEVNASPQWKGIQKVANVNPAKALARHLILLAKK